MFSEELPADVSETVVCDDETTGNEEPVYAFQQVVDDEVCLTDDEDQGHVSEGELAELETILALLQAGDEPDESHDVEDETDEAVVLGQWQKQCIYVDNVFEVVNQCLSISEVYCRREEVPVDRLEPWDLMLLRRHSCDSENLVEYRDLYHGQEEDNPDGSRGEHDEKTSYHDPRPYESYDRIARGRGRGRLCHFRQGSVFRWRG